MEIFIHCLLPALTYENESVTFPVFQVRTSRTRSHSTAYQARTLLHGFSAMCPDSSRSRNWRAIRSYAVSPSSSIGRATARNFSGRS